MEFLLEYGLFLAKAVTWVAAIGIVIALLAAVGSSHRKNAQKGSIVVSNYNEEIEQMSDSILVEILDSYQLKKLHKNREKQEKAESKAAKKAAKSKGKDDKKKIQQAQGAEQDKAVSDDAAASTAEAQNVSDTSKTSTISPSRKAQHFVLDFEGDIRAQAVDTLRQEISAVLNIAQPQDEIILRLESGGGMVHAYGLAASQLQRIRDAGLKLTVCVDMVAASGGYMMACLGDKIIAAPFAVIGSIGVVVELPNFHRLLQKHDIDFDVYTAGKHKRSVTIMGKNTRDGKNKLEHDLQITHDLFKRWVAEQRPEVNIGEVADGDVWYGQEALANNLIDELGTSDAYLQNLVKNEQPVIQVSYEIKKNLGEKIGAVTSSAAEVISQRFQSVVNRSRIER